MSVESKLDHSRIAIALSGGGSRAMAFHLGCLRTLNALGVLQRARVISAVSGGTVLGAMYAVHEGTFEEFDARVHEVLRIGFVRPALRTALATTEGVRAVLAWVALSLHWLWTLQLAAVLRLTSVGASNDIGVRLQRAGPRRFASRTTILRRTFDDLLFDGRRLGSLPPDRPRLVVLAAELRTGTAFYFGRKHAGSYRFGTIDPTDIPLSLAVAASAAYPLFLPALDEIMTFRRRDGSLATERVTLTDGGVYDNLGLSSLWPDRDASISVGVEPIDTIIACRAGYRATVAAPSVFFRARMAAAFECVFARAQNAGMKRLFDLKESKRLRNFVLPYIDQDDDQLRFAPPDLVRRTAVAGYPTDFSAMAPDWIDRLSKRGEQLTLAVIREHAPELLPPDWHPSQDAPAVTQTQESSVS